MDISEFLALLALVIAVVFAGASLWNLSHNERSKKNDKRLDEVEYSLKASARREESAVQIHDSIVGALHALLARQTAQAQHLQDISVDDFYDQIDVEKLYEIEKSLTELGLFSEDQVRRISAQRTLAHSSGDYESLELMKAIERGELGKRDEEVVAQIAVLEKRLIGNGGERWEGRPSGGQF